MGFTGDAMKRFRQNRDLATKKAPFQRLKENYFIPARSSGAKFKKATKAELKDFREKLIKSNEKDSRTRLLIFISTVLSLGFVFWLLLFHIKFF